MEKIEFSGVRGDLRALGLEIMAAIEDVMESGEFILGSHVAEFEDAVCNYLGVKHAIGMSSGSDALMTALHCAGIERGDAVVTTPYSFVSTVSAILMLGAIPVYADISPHTYNLNPSRVREVLESRNDIRAILPVHLFGQPCHMEAILREAAEFDVIVIEDACQAFGADVPFAKKRGAGTIWRKAGTIGNVGCFSFHPTKVLGAIGDAGMCVTNDAETAKDLRAMRNHGQYLYKYQHDDLGWNMRMDGIQAAVLLEKLKHIDDLIALRRVVASQYESRLAGLYPLDLPDTSLGIQDYTGAFNTHTFSQYAVRVAGGHRDDLAEHLRKADVPVGIHYPRIIPDQPMFSDLDDRVACLDEARILAKENLCLPMHPWLSPDQVEYICKSIHGYYQEHGLTRDQEEIEEA